MLQTSWSYSAAGATTTTGSHKQPELLLLKPSYSALLTTAKGMQIGLCHAACELLSTGSSGSCT
jgi:hypothetical protein